MNVSRAAAILAATQYFDEDVFLKDLAALVAVETDSRSGNHIRQLHAYLSGNLAPRLSTIGFDCVVHTNPVPGGGPLLLASRMENPNLPTVLCYGHGDVTPGTPEMWREELSPFVLTVDGDRIYGRGTADNKGQHLINIAAAEVLLQTQEKLGFNLKFLIEMSEETGSAGLGAFISENKDALAADVLIASDGPRLHADTPTIFTGARGCINFDLVVDLREDARHSGNWGGVLADPGIVLANAIAALCDPRGQIRLPGWRTDSLTPEIRASLADLPQLDDGEGPAIDADWGEESLTPAERLFGWNAFSVLGMRSGSVASPDHAIQPKAEAVCHLRFVVGADPKKVITDLRCFLATKGFANVQVQERPGLMFEATRTDPGNPWVKLVRQSILETTGKPAHYLPNLGGSLPNEFFANTLGLPTIWIPHSYRGCSQHAPNEHNLKSLCREGLQVMAGVFWDVGNAQWQSPGPLPQG